MGEYTHLSLIWLMCVCTVHTCTYSLVLKKKHDSFKLHPHAYIASFLSSSLHSIVIFIIIGTVNLKGNQGKEALKVYLNLFLYCCPTYKNEDRLALANC